MPKNGDYWWVYFDQYHRKKMGAVRSKDLIHWEDVSDRVRLPKGTGYGSFFSVKKDLLDKLLKTELSYK